jgi:thioester reductase-like protein
LVYDDNGKISALVVPTVPNDSNIIHGIKQGIRKVNEGLPPYKRIVGLDFCSQEFPKTTTLKVKRREVMEWLKEKREKTEVAYVPPVTARQKLLVDAFERALGRRKVGIQDDFFELGGDSLSAIEVATMAGVQAQDIYENPTVEKLERAVIANEQSAAEEEHVDVNALIRHNNNLVCEVEPKYILLTGATGFLGAHILRELLRRRMNVVCLVRNEDRLKPTMKTYFPKEYEYFTYKVVKGDIEQPHFGLTDTEYETLISKVDMVIHTAANVRHTGHYEDLERTNVIGTQNVIDFCMDANAILQYTSTASVNGAGTVKQTNPDATFDEFNLDIGQEYSQNVYIHSKYKAEERVLLAREAGLRTNIFRIGNLTWRMSDGKFQKNAQDNGFLHRCRGLFKIGMYSKELAEYPIDFTAVDECADAYVRLALHNRVNNIYNLYNPNVVRLETLCSKMWTSIKRVPKDVFEMNLKGMIQDKEIAVLSFYNTIASASRNVPISNDFTVNELKKLGFKWSKIGPRYLRYLKTL